MNIGILGVAKYLPREVRRNDWWLPEVVARWAAQSSAVDTADATSAEDTVIAAMRSQAADPFQGARERRVLASDQTVLDLELGAAHAAIERAGIDHGEIDLVLTDSLGQPALATNAACSLHHHLALRSDCFTLQTEGAQHAFILQLSIAEAMIRAGRARCGLLVQSTAASRLLDYDEPLSAVFGDGATAAVVGPVASGYGLLATWNRTHGARPYVLIACVPGGAWYDEGRAYLHIADPAAMQDIVFRAVERSTESVVEVLALAGLRREDVAVFAMHQATPWMRRMVQERAGIHAARAVDTFCETGHLFGASTLSTLVAAQERGELDDGDVVVIASGGNGMTYGAAVVRWGRG